MDNLFSDVIDATDRADESTGDDDTVTAPAFPLRNTIDVKKELEAVKALELIPALNVNSVSK